MSDTAAKAFLSGIQAELPILVGVIPFGMIYGALAISAGIPHLQAQAMSAVVFAGSAQFVTAQLVHQGVPALVIFLTVGVVNLRHALYSASLAPFVKHLPVRWKILLAYLLTDEAYAVTITHYLDSLPPPQGEAEPVANTHHTPGDVRHFFFLGAGLALWTTWQLSTAAGILVGEIIPQSWSLDFTLALTFIALVVPNLKDRPAVAAALSAGLTAVLAVSLPYKLGLFLAAIIGVTTGMVLEKRGANRPVGVNSGA